MRKRLMFGAGALALLIGAGAAQAQSVGISVGYGSPSYYDTGWSWDAAYRPYSWGGPNYVGSYYAPTYAPAYSYGAGGYVYGFDEASGQPIVTRRVVVTTAPAPVTTTVAVPLTSRIPVAATAPAYDEVVATGSISGGEHVQPRTVVRARKLSHRLPRVAQRRALAENRSMLRRPATQY
jgi:hypothetical protein